MLLSKVKQYNLDSDFYRHIHKQVEVIKVNKNLQLPKVASHCQLSCHCKLMRETVEKQCDRLDHLANPVSLLKIDISELKCTPALLETFFVGDLLPIHCEIVQSCRPSLKKSLSVTFCNDGATPATYDDDFWKSHPTAAVTHKIILLRNFGKISLAEIQPEPKDNWTHTKYSVNDGSDVTNGVSNVFDGHFFFLERKKGFLFNGQNIGECNFVRPAIAKSHPCCINQV